MVFGLTVMSADELSKKHKQTNTTTRILWRDNFIIVLTSNSHHTYPINFKHYPQ